MNQNASRGMMRLCMISALCFLCTSSLHAQWIQVWGGDFTGAAGTSYNHANWWNNVRENTGNVWGDGTIESTSDSLSNVYLDGNGDLVIAMTYNPSPGAGQTNYTSARLTSTYAAGPTGEWTPASRTRALWAWEPPSGL